MGKSGRFWVIMDKTGKKSPMRAESLESFIGKATLAIDATGRTNLPKDFRKVLSDENQGQVVVTIAESRTLVLFPLSEWNRYVRFIAWLGKGPEGFQIPHTRHRHGQALRYWMRRTASRFRRSKCAMRAFRVK